MKDTQLASQVGPGVELRGLVVAAESAKLGVVEARVGLHPLMGAIRRFAQRAGAARAKEMAMLGRRYDARTLEGRTAGRRCSTSAPE